MISSAPVGGQASPLFLIIFSTYAETDPQAAWDLALSIKNPEIREEALSVVGGKIARKDPTRLLSMADAIADLKIKGRMRFMAIQGISEKDPQRAFTIATENSDFAALYLTFPNWVAKDPEAALKAALTIPETVGRQTIVAEAVSNWADRDFAAALNYTIALDDAEMRGSTFQALSNRSEGNRRELFDAVIEHMPSGTGYQNMVTGLLSRWASENPAEAAQAVMELSPGDTFSSAARGIASEWISSSKNKQEVFDWAKNLPEGNIRTQALSALYQKWSTIDGQAALRSLAFVPPEARKEVIGALATGWSKTSPQEVLQWSASLTDAAERTNVINKTLSEWVKNAPDVAAKYVENLGGTERQSAMTILVEKWADSDTEAAAAWVKNQPPGPVKDPALQVLSSKIAEEDPESALTLIAGIKDEKFRSIQIKNIASQWISQDPKAARAWISNSNLPEETRKELLK